MLYGVKDGFAEHATSASPLAGQAAPGWAMVVPPVAPRVSNEATMQGPMMSALPPQRPGALKSPSASASTRYSRQSAGMHLAPGKPVRATGPGGAAGAGAGEAPGFGAALGAGAGADELGGGEVTKIAAVHSGLFCPDSTMTCRLGLVGQAVPE